MCVCVWCVSCTHKKGMNRDWMTERQRKKNFFFCNDFPFARCLRNFRSHPISHITKIARQGFFFVCSRVSIDYKRILYLAMICRLVVLLSPCIPSCSGAHYNNSILVALMPGHSNNFSLSFIMTVGVKRFGSYYI